jgi:hypothetical protein
VRVFCFVLFCFAQWGHGVGNGMSLVYLVSGRLLGFCGFCWRSSIDLLGSIWIDDRSRLCSLHFERMDLLGVFDRSLEIYRR